MLADRVFSSVGRFAARLQKLKDRRYQEVSLRRDKGVWRQRLTKADREEVLRKTGRRCHICGGLIDGNDWQADHVMAHSTGGEHAVDNFLPAHTICNNYRWHYGPEEFQWILKLGVWLKTQIVKDKPIGRTAGQAFCDNDRRRAGRRK